MHDAMASVIPEDSVHQRFIGNVANNQRHIVWHEFPSPRGKVVNNDDIPIRVAKRQNYMAADVSSPAGDKDIF